MKDHTGNKISVYATLGASNHSSTIRQNEDYYATDPKCVEELLKRECFNESILEPACGQGHISKVLEQYGYKVASSDIIDRGYGGVQDFLSPDVTSWYGDIITNPPYKYAQDFVEKALSIVNTGNKVAMFLKLTFLEGKARKRLFEITPPNRVFVFSERQKCGPNGDFSKVQSSAVCYAWFVWEKGFNGDTVIKWI